MKNNIWANGIWSWYHKILQDKRWVNISNIFTLIRILLSPVIVWQMYCLNWNWAFGFFVVGAITDLLDGYLARLFDTQTNLGRMLDPVADKIFLVSSFFSLSFISTPSFHIPSWFVYLLLFREFALLLGCVLLFALKINFDVQPIMWGKLTTVFQILFIVWIFSCYFFHWIPLKTYSVSLVLLAGYSIFSLLQYIRVGFNYLKR
ncbi:MAG: CDP-alcohol phosphatidyltransferase family protein [bacterium]